MLHRTPSSSCEQPHHTDQDLRQGAEALLLAQRPGTTWEDLSEGERGNLEADVEAVLDRINGSYTSPGRAA